MLNATLTAAERDDLAADARPTVRVLRRAAAARISGRRHRRPELAPYPLTRPMHYTSGTTGQAQGRHHRHLGRGHGPARVRGRGRGLALRPDGPAHGLLADVPHGLHPLRQRHPAGRRLAGHPEPLRRRHRARHPAPAPARPPPSWSRRTCSASCRSPSLGADERFDSLRLLAHAGAPCPDTVKRAVMDRVRPGGVWEFYGSTEAQFTVCAPEDWLEHPGTVGRARPGRRLHIVPVTDADDADAGATTVHRRQPPAPSGATCPTSPASATGATPRPRRPPGTGMPAPSATSAASMRTATSTSPAAATTSSSAGASTSTRPRSRTCWPRSTGIAEVAVFGMPDEQWGQRVCAAYVADPGVPRKTSGRGGPAGRRGRAPGPATSGPSRITPPRELPHTATGKLLRRSVAEHLGLPG